MRSFMPKQAAFFDLLEKVDDISQAMVKLFSKFAKDFGHAEKYVHQASKLEHEGDDMTHEIIDRLNRTFITPFDREDIYSLANELDDLIDLMEKVIQDVHLYGIVNKIEAIDHFASLIQKASKHQTQLLSHLRGLKYTPQFLRIKTKIHELEDDGDEIYQRAIKELFQREKDPITVLKFKGILEDLEAIMDKYQGISNLVEGIIVKSS